MHPQLVTALADAAPLIATRGWMRPSDAALADAERLMVLVAAYRAPSVQIEPDGTLGFEWEAADQGWLKLVVDGRGQLAHSAVIGEDEFEKTEAFGDALPDWASRLLARLMQAGH